MQLPRQGEYHSEEASLLLEAGIISGTEFLQTDRFFWANPSGSNSNKLTFILVEIAGTVTNRSSNI